MQVSLAPLFFTLRSACGHGRLVCCCCRTRCFCLATCRVRLASHTCTGNSEPPLRSDEMTENSQRKFHTKKRREANTTGAIMQHARTVSTKTCCHSSVGHRVACTSLHCVSHVSSCHSAKRRAVAGPPVPVQVRLRQLHPRLLRRRHAQASVTRLEGSLHSTAAGIRSEMHGPRSRHYENKQSVREGCP